MAASITIINTRAVTGGRVTACNIRLADGKIRGILPPGDAYGKTFDAKGGLVLPGFIDLHTHGAMGVDFNTAKAKEIQATRNFFAAQGVTTFLPTILADTEENMLRAVLSVAKARGALGCTQIGGIHLEGPFLAHHCVQDLPPQLLQTPSYPIYRRIQDACEGLVKMVTLSPELPDAAALTGRLSGESVRVSLGHTQANYEDAVAAIEAGAVGVTHFLDTIPWMTPENPGLCSAALEHDIYCEMLFDGQTFHPAMLRLILKIKGLHRLIATTGSMMATGLRDGPSYLGAAEVKVQGGQSRGVRSGQRVGTTLTMLQVLHNLMELTTLPIEQAILPLTENPARLLGISHQKGAIDVGKDADLVILNQNWQVSTTFSLGEVLYSID